ncbi:MAG TPA: ABC transporter permease [Bryobacteraceae bacterium]|nr:ABC transporter permease [Bryobacteraceae bacterium]
MAAFLQHINDMPKDVVYGLRMLAKSPGFTLVALLSLALGIGANTAIFSVVNRILLHPVAYPDPDRLLVVWNTNPSLGIRQSVASVPDYEDWKTQNHVFEQMAAMQSGSANVTGISTPQRVQVFEATPNVFSLFGIQPDLGRGFASGDQRENRRVVVLDYAFWQRSFGGDKTVLSKTITLDGENFSIIGVLPKNFYSFGRDLWRLLVFSPTLVNARASHNEFVVARLKPEVSLAAAQAEMSTIAKRIELAHPDTNTGNGVSLMVLTELFVGSVRPAMLILFAAVGFVLLIACANVANLMLARSSGRRREVAVRIALGGSRARIVRQLLTESLLLSILAGTAGLLIAMWGTAALMKLLPGSMSQNFEVPVLSASVLEFSLLLSIAIGFLFGLAPALQGSKLNLNESLREGGRSGTAGSARQRFRSILAVGEVALSLVLLAGAGLLIESFLRLAKSNPGFQPDNTLTMELSLPYGNYGKDEQQILFYDRLLAKLRALPGLSQAALVSNLPLQGHSGHNSFQVEGFPPVKSINDLPIADQRMVSADYFGLMGIPVLRGRAFNERDKANASGVAIVDEATAKQYWPNQDPIGKRIAYFDADAHPLPWITVVGVVGSVKQNRIEEAAGTSVYLPLAQSPSPEFALAVRGTVSAASVMGAIHAIDGDLPVGKIRTMQEIVDQSTGLERVAAQLVSIFAAVALALAIIGTYGVMAYSVAQRTQEFGIRIALGAKSGDVLKLVLRRGLILTASGIVLGLVASVGVTRFMSSVLFEVQPGDPLILGSAALILGAVAMLASYLPARRATKVDPMLALRYE